MTFPLRKDESNPEQPTTADLAKANRPAEASPELVEGRKPARSELFRVDAPAQSPATTSPGTAIKKNTPTPAEATALFPDDQLKELQARWDDIQTGFVDEPRSAVERADGLVAHAMQQLAEAFARERANLERQWDSGDNISTEDLRVAFQRYRSFFRRLLSM
jgi:hypothetical protein